MVNEVKLEMELVAFAVFLYLLASMDIAWSGMPF